MYSAERSSSFYINVESTYCFRVWCVFCKFRQHIDSFFKISIVLIWNEPFWNYQDQSYFVMLITCTKQGKNRKSANTVSLENCFSRDRVAHLLSVVKDCRYGEILRPALNLRSSASPKSWCHGKQLSIPFPSKGNVIFHSITQCWKRHFWTSSACYWQVKSCITCGSEVRKTSILGKMWDLPVFLTGCSFWSK